MSVTPIFAESYRIFRTYLSEHQLNPRHFAYIHSDHNIRGYRGVAITIGRWWRNPKYRNIDFYGILNSMVTQGTISVIHGSWVSEDRYLLLRRNAEKGKYVDASV